MNVSTYNISTHRKDPTSTTKISTFAVQEKTVKNRHGDKGRMGNSTVVPFTPIKEKDTERSSEDGGHRHLEHECPSCKGFYCRTCKSSVPPKYRPVPDENGNYHFHEDK